MLKSTYTSGEYLIAAFLNAFLLSSLLFSLVFVLSIGKSTMQTSIQNALLPGVAALLLLFLLYLYYPRIQVKKIVEEIDKDLVFALKDLTIQIMSGVTLFEAMRNISNANYGKLSKEFEIVVKDINSGEPQEKALEKMALRTESEFLKRITWQIISVLKSGSSLRNALESITTSVKQHQANQIKTYIQEMNLWTLLYGIIGVAIPSLGITVIVILSSISGIKITEFTFFILLLLCFIAELVIIQYVKVKRPALQTE
ncbi:type II secretion system F family protein [Candidatus Micrarchaeota archaeon]|nr:type II secretion system F family protein [Candidatus Micrarchaeota archaeon]